jgi:hypothetical protein
MPAYGGPRYTIVQLLHRMWPRRSTIAELMPHCATPGELGFLPESGGVRSEYQAASRIVTASMLARASAGVR